MGTEQMECKIAHALYDAITVPKHDPTTTTIQISRDDLDGYSCTIVSRTVEHIMFGKTPVGAVVHHNTHAQDDELYNFIGLAIRAAFINNGGYAILKTVNVIISDLSSLEVDKLVTLIAERRSYYPDNINFIIVDHHRSVYDSVVERVRYANIDICEAFAKLNGAYDYGQTTYKLDVKLDGYNKTGWLIQAVGKNSIKTVRVMYYSNSECSATKLLARSIMQYHAVINMTEKVYDKLLKFAELVSAYDTGDFGNWRVQRGERVVLTNPIISVISNYPISDQIFMQLAFGVCYNPASSRHYQLFEDINIATITDTTNTYISVYPAEIKRKIADKIITMNEKYDSFTDRIQSIDSSRVRMESGVLQFEFDAYPGKIFVMKTPLAILSSKIPAVFDYAKGIDGHEPTSDYNFSLYSKEYMETTGHDFFIRILAKPDGRYEVALRSTEGGPNCYKIAKANGGGGHPRTAGFMIGADNDAES